MNSVETRVGYKYLVSLSGNELRTEIELCQIKFYMKVLYKFYH